MVEASDTTSNSSRGSRGSSKSSTSSKLTAGYSESALGQKDIADVYNEIGADQYDEWAIAVNYTTPNYLTDLIGKGAKLEIDSDSEILDVGAGSGVIGKLLM